MLKKGEKSLYDIMVCWRKDKMKCEIDIMLN